MRSGYSVVYRLVVLCAALLFWTQALAQDDAIRGACERFERSNIDCACVAKKVATFQSKAPSINAREIIAQGYFYSVGVSNDLLQRMERVYSDPIGAMEMMEAFDSLGGRPENLDDYENGCVIAGARRASFAQPRDTEMMQQYRKACVAASGQQRYCACEGAQLQTVLSDREFEAYFRSFADYSDKEATTRAQMAQARGKAMGLDADAYQELPVNARNKVSKHRQERETYCHAMVWADDAAGASAAVRQNGGFSPELLSSAVESDQSIAHAQADAPAATANGAAGVGSARDRLFNICMSDNNNQAMCECMGTQMEQSMPPDTFEFFVDLREGDAKGVEDSFAYAAKKRGMNTVEAMNSMGGNMAMLSAAGTTMLSCMGDLPGMN